MTKAETRLTSTLQLSIPFHDLDPMDVCWHGNYVRYLELARTQLWEKIGYSYPEMRDSGYAYPVIELYIRYAQPLVYRQQIEIVASLVEWENRLKVDYLIRDQVSQRRLTKAYTVQVAVAIATREMCFVSPPLWKEKLEPWL